MITIRPLEVPGDVATYRDIRLRALRSDPAAFGSNHGRERHFDDATWAERMTGFAGRPGVVLGAAGPEGLVGIGGIGLTDDERTSRLWGMWVAPEARGDGVARRIVTAALAWSAARSVERVVLDVIRDNPGAIELYRSIGFIEDPAGPAADGPCRDEVAMELVLDQLVLDQLVGDQTGG